MNIPKLDLAKSGAWFYHAHVCNKEAHAGDLEGLVADLEAGYEQSGKEARAVFDQ
jgi:hypothetical protein